MLNRAERRTLAVTAVIVAATRLIPLSRGPWDWDEVLFCLGLGEYDVAAHQPHPAGFPLFILLGRIARLAIDSDFRALQAVNVVASMLLFPVLVWLARSCGMAFAPSLASSLIVVFLPNVWFYGGTAFSDPVALLLFLAAVAAFLSADGRPRRYIVASILLGAGMLIRPQSAVIALFPWAAATARMVKTRNARGAVAGTCIAALICVSGYAIAAAVTGVDAYVTAVREHGEYVRNADSIFSGDRPSLRAALSMLLDPYDAGKVSLLINGLALIGLVAGKRKLVRTLLLTFLPPFLLVLLAANPLGASRMSLAYMPGLILLAIEGVSVLARLVPRLEVAAHAAVVAVIVGRLVVWVLPAFESPRATQPPPVAAALWVRDHVPPGATVFTDDATWPWVRYYLPRHRQVRVREPALAVFDPAVRDGWFVGVGEAPANAHRSFQRPKNRTWNIVTRRGFEAYVIPAAHLVLFADGWHAPEHDDGRNERWRWSSGEATLVLPPASTPCELTVAFDAPVDAAADPTDVTFLLDGQQLPAHAATEGNNVARFVVPAVPRPRKLTMGAERTFVPARDTPPSADTRELGVMVREVRWNCRPR